jgi:hypothetical protein
MCGSAQCAHGGAAGDAAARLAAELDNQARVARETAEAATLVAAKKAELDVIDQNVARLRIEAAAEKRAASQDGLAAVGAFAKAVKGGLGPLKFTCGQVKAGCLAGERVTNGAGADAALFAPKKGARRAKYLEMLSRVNAARASKIDDEEALSFVMNERRASCDACAEKQLASQNERDRVGKATTAAYKEARFLNTACACGKYCGGLFFTLLTLGALSYEHKDPKTKPKQKSGKKARPPVSTRAIFRAIIVPSL